MKDADVSFPFVCMEIPCPVWDKPFSVLVRKERWFLQIRVSACSGGGANYPLHQPHKLTYAQADSSASIPHHTLMTPMPQSETSFATVNI
jgi:hypothetical protein